MSETQNKKSVVNIVGLIAVGVSVLTMFLPYAVYDDGSWSSLLTRGDWIFELILAGIAFFLSIKKIRSGTINTLGFFSIGAFDAFNTMIYTSNSSDYAYARSIGFYMLYISTICVIAAGIYSIILSKKSSE